MQVSLLVVHAKLYVAKHSFAIMLSISKACVKNQITLMFFGFDYMSTCSINVTYIRVQTVGILGWLHVKHCYTCTLVQNYVVLAQLTVIAKLRFARTDKLRLSKSKACVRQT